MKLNTWILAGTVVLGIGIGFVVGRGTAPSSPSLESDWIPEDRRKSTRTSVRRSRLPIPDFGLEISKDVEHALRIYDESAPGEVNWELVNAMRDALYQPHSSDRSRQWLILMGAMRPEDALEVRKLFQEGDKNAASFGEQWLQFWNRWGQVDGQGALMELAKESNRDMKRAVIEAAAGWAAADPQPAIRWLSELDPEHFHWMRISSAVVGGYARHDLQAATDLSLDLSEIHPESLPSSMGQLAEAAVLGGGIESVTRWLEMFPEDNEMRQRAFGHARYLVQRAGREALSEWLTSLTAQPYRQDSDYRNLAREWSGEDVAGALAWATSQAPSPHDGTYTGVADIMRNAMDSEQIPVVRRWLEVNPEHAAAASVRQLLQSVVGQ